MRKLKDVKKMVNESRPKTHYEKALHEKRLRERREARRHLKLAQEQFKDKETRQLNLV